MRYLYLTCACLLATFSLSAQQNFVPGTVLLRNNDSIRGQIDYRKWDMCPLQIVFREGGVEKIYKPADIKGFHITDNDELYLSIAAGLDVTNEDVSTLANTAEREIITGEHFFRVVVNGKVKLLLFNDRSNREHFAVMENDNVTQLVRKKIYDNDPDSEDYGKVKVNSYYRQQLANLVGDCVSEQKFQRLDYSEKEFRKILQQYLECRYPGDKVSVIRSERLTRVRYGVLAGASYNTFSFSGNHQLAYGTYKNQVAPVAGIFMDVPLSRNHEKLSWNTELVYTTHAFSSRFPWYSNADAEVDVNLKYVQLQTMIKYTYPRWKVRPYANIGLVGILKTGGKDEVKMVHKEDGRIVSEGPALGSGQEFLLPFMGGVGVRFGNLHVELRYFTPQNISPYLNLKANVRSMHLVVKYMLF